MQEKRIQTRWTDFDALSHVTHAAFPVYLDEARDGYLASTVGSFSEWPCVVAHVSIDYRKEIRYPAPEVLVRTRISEVGRTSVTFEQEVLAAAGEIAAAARSVVVAWDPDARAARRDRRDRAHRAGRSRRLTPACRNGAAMPAHDAARMDFVVPEELRAAEFGACRP